MTTVDFLTRVRALVARGSCQGAGCRSAEGRMLIICLPMRDTDLYCLTGACQMVGLETGDRETYAAALIAMQATLSLPMLLTRWNDSHSLEERLDLIDRTIEREKAK